MENLDRRVLHSDSPRFRGKGRGEWKLPKTADVRVVLNNETSPVADVLHEPAVRASQVVPHVVSPRSGDDRREGGKVAFFEVFGREKDDADPELLQELRDRVLRSPDIADREILRDDDVDDFDFRLGGFQKIRRRDVRMLQDVERLIERTGGRLQDVGALFRSLRNGQGGREALRVVLLFEGEGSRARALSTRGAARAEAAPPVSGGMVRQLELDSDASLARLRKGNDRERRANANRNGGLDREVARQLSAERVDRPGDDGLSDERVRAREVVMDARGQGDTRVGDCR